MLDPISLLTGAGILTGGLGAGHISGRISEKRRNPKVPKDGVCEGCDHHYSLHSSEKSGGGVCMYEKHFRMCPCGRFIGIKPYAELEA